MSHSKVISQRHPHVPLDELAEVFPGLSVARKVSDDGADTPIIGVGDLDGVGNVAATVDLERATLPVGRSTDGYRVRAGDVLLTARGTLLKVGLVDEATDGAVLSANLLCIRARSDRLLPGALAAWLITPTGQAALTGRYHSTAGMLALTTPVVKGLPVPVPPLATQVRAAALLDATRIGYVAARRAADSRQALGLAALARLFTLEDPS
jgi:hypothetical protein